MGPPRRGDAVELLLKHGADPYQAAAGIPQETQEIYPFENLGLLWDLIWPQARDPTIF